MFILGLFSACTGLFTCPLANNVFLQYVIEEEALARGDKILSKRVLSREMRSVGSLLFMSLMASGAR